MFWRLELRRPGTAEPGAGAWELEVLVEDGGAAEVDARAGVAAEGRLQVMAAANKRVLPWEFPKRVSDLTRVVLFWPF